MPTLHRTQVLLERRHYEMLKRLAHEEGLSLSALLRQILDQSLFQPEKPSKRPNLEALAGLGRDPHLTGRDHDQALYGRST
ncbi:ribbon-helix-helix domain-containing protein [Candidatus Acetothermia bacterium]|nr:ribbon-helix-helix domain-containing protein [Candidatus Acetothermia bacterium]MBI3660265.1 ribbon-helix-helix domain-containing protein [Candidatus Acetothermia bacterium]